MSIWLNVATKNFSPTRSRSVLLTRISLPPFFTTEEMVCFGCSELTRSNQLESVIVVNVSKCLDVLC